MLVRISPFIAALIGLLAAPLIGGSQQALDRVPGSNGSVTVQLLAINDFHGNLEAPSGSAAAVGTIEAGGAEYLATHLKNAVAQNPNSIIVAAGDLVGASPLLSGLFHDEPAIESLNAMNLAVSSVGNHEFDEGWHELLRMQKGSCHPTDGCQDGDGFDGAKFQYLSANVVDKRTSPAAPLLPATKVLTVGGVKIGFIGETLRGTPQIVTPDGVRDLAFLDEASTANRQAAQLRRQGVNAIVLLIHEGGRQTMTEGSPDPNGCANFRGPIERIARKLSSSIKVVISGHTHTFYNCTIRGRLVTSAGSFGRLFTRINLTVNRATGTILATSATNQVVSRDVAKDPVQTRIIEKYDALSASIADRVVGTVTADISRTLNHAGESALGDVIADAQLASVSAPQRGGAVVAFMNDGGIRADLMVGDHGGSSPPGQVTYGELFMVQPFGNVVTVLTMTGDAIRRLLEQQFDNPGPGRQEMLQVSNGFTYRYALDAPPGSRVDPSSIRIGGRVIAPADRVRVAANNFLVAGGDGFTMFARGTNQIGGELDIDALAAYFKARSPIPPGPQNRIVRTD
jgi:5'-nucleotidase